MIDTHTHLNFKSFRKNWQRVVRKALHAGVEKMIVVGTDVESSKRAIEMAQNNDALFAAVGIHPHHAQIFVGKNSDIVMNNHLADILELAKFDRVVAIGEIGLDYHHYTKSRYDDIKDNNQWEELLALQKLLFSRQIEIAKEINKPLIIHSRDAGFDVLNSVLDISKKINWKVSGVFHCFEGNDEYLKMVLEAGFYISFTGNITFLPVLSELAKQVPLDRLLLETDCPFLAPFPFRGQRNEPKNVKIIANHHSSIRKVQLNEVMQKTTQNASRLFNL